MLELGGILKMMSSRDDAPVRLRDTGQGEMSLRETQLGEPVHGERLFDLLPCILRKKAVEVLDAAIACDSVAGHQNICQQHRLDAQALDPNNQFLPSDDC